MQTNVWCVLLKSYCGDNWRVLYRVFCPFQLCSPVILYCVIFLWKFTLTTHVALSIPVFLKGVGFKVVSWCELLYIMGFCAAQTRCFFALALVHKLAWRVVHPAAIKPQTTVTLCICEPAFFQQWETKQKCVSENAHLSSGRRLPLHYWGSSCQAVAQGSSL